MKPQTHNNNLIKNNQGFTLIEILVALFLVALVMGLAISNPFSSSADIEKEVNGIERAIRFMSDESAFRNTITRLHIYLNKDPQEYAVEYGPSSQFVLPPKEDDSPKILTKDEEEKKAKDTKETNQKFARISEFQDSNSELGGNVKVMAVGNSQTNTLQTNGEVSIYSYPSGEKDETFIVLAQDETVATITTSAFTSKISHNYYHLDKSDGKDLNEAIQKKAKELFDIWLKDKK